MHRGTTIKRGFTLIEMMVAVGLFSVVMVVSVSSLVVVMSASARAQAVQATTDNLSFAMDRMSREIRYATDIRCNFTDTRAPVGTDDCASGATSITFTNTIGGIARTSYQYVGAVGTDSTYVLQKKVGGGTWTDITASTVKVLGARFFVKGAYPPGDRKQPQVTILLRAVPTGYSSDVAGVNLQTTVTQRALDY